MKIRLWVGLVLASIGGAQTTGASSSTDGGLPVGAQIPEFEAVDQTGTPRRFASIAGPKGAVLVFYRSADW